MTKALSEITALMDMQVNASQARLRQVRLREEALLALLVELDQQKQLTATRDATSTAQIVDFQNDVQLRRWVDQRRASVNGELAQVRALIAMAQEDLAKHFARQQAAEKLADTAKTAAITVAKRKTYYGS